MRLYGFLGELSHRKVTVIYKCLYRVKTAKYAF